MTTLQAPLRSAPVERLSADLCVVGGGMAGLCAAIAAARHGARVVLLQDRAVLGGNASSEVRMWICGAHGADNRETGILEEILLENCALNPELKYPVWDSLLYGKARYQDGLDLRLSCSVCEVETEGNRISLVRAWHLTRQCWIEVAATLYADCSGDSILRLSGAPHRWGREARDEFGESHAPAVADRKTMGNSILIQLREIDEDRHRAFVAPEWAHRYDDETVPKRRLQPSGCNFWWLEIGGEDDTVADADAIRDELLRVAYGVWAYIKNHPDGRGRRWELEWIGALPGKRENVRYEGDHILTQHDVEAGGPFDDLVAYGGWTMDDHHPGGIRHPGDPTIFHPAPSPYGIPWRCLYSRAVDNLLFAGRNISATHMALSSTRVMATCALLGQAVGTGAAIAVRAGCTPRDVGRRHIAELQQRLMDDDVYLPGVRRQVPPLARAATLHASAGDAAPLRDGIDRRLGEDWHAWTGTVGSVLTYDFGRSVHVPRLRIVADSQLHRTKRMPASWPKGGHHQPLPPPLLRHARIEARDGGVWRCVGRISDNRRRLIVVALDLRCDALRLVVEGTWGDETCRLFAFDVGLPDYAAPIDRHARPEPLLNVARASA